MARTAGSGWWALAGLAGCLALAQAVGCGVEADGPADGPSSDAVQEAISAYLAHVGPGVLLPSLETMRSRTLDLQDAVDAWADAVGTDGQDAARQAAQEAWLDAFAQWQILEVMQLGPLVSSVDADFGRDLRDAIYSWPLVSPCKVDQETAAGNFTDDGWVGRSLVNTRGLDALEYLLFVDTDGNACPPQVTPNDDGTWAALSTEEVWSTRAAYAGALNADVTASLDDAIEAWSPDGDDLSAALADPRVEGSPWASPQQALNHVYDALFYVYKRKTDRKIGQPLGVNDCSSAPCLDAVEAPHAGWSHRALVANDDGFEALFTGGDGPGMDDILEAAGEGDLAERILTLLEDARAAADGLDAPLDDLLVDDPDAVEALHAAAKAFADAFRRDVAPVLQLSVPQEAAGDND